MIKMTVIFIVMMAVLIMIMKAVLIIHMMTVLIIIMMVAWSNRTGAPTSLRYSEINIIKIQMIC